MREQPSLASVVYDGKRKVTRRERFLTEMDRVIPWAPLLALLAPKYPKAGRGHRPTMRRVYFLQQWFDLSDPKAEDMLCDSESMRRLAKVDLGADAVPDESTILRFRHVLGAQQLAQQILDTVRALLEDHTLLLKAGNSLDATSIAAPGSTKIATQTRDPAMRQTLNGSSGTPACRCTSERARVASCTR